MKLPEAILKRAPSRAQTVGLVLFLVGALLMILAYGAQTSIDRIGATNDPLLKDRVTTLGDQRNLYLVVSIGALFMGLFAIAMLGEPSMPAIISQSGMISTARMANDTVRGMSLRGNACYLPPKHGLSKERVMIASTTVFPSPPSALSDDQIMSPGKDGSTPGMIFEPLGLGLLGQLEEELNTATSGAGLEAAEGTMQVLKHGLGIVKDFHFKERDGKTILRVEYSGLLDACRSVRKDIPDTCRQMACIGCSCLLTGAARATGKAVTVEEVDNKNDNVIFTLTLKDW